MRPQTATKLAIVAAICILFAGIVLRAAMKLAATAMHSILGAIVVVLLVAWVVVKAK